ncbi:MAG: YjgP/YjgQ family permease [Rhodospirillaceae bacterium]|nr:YjgP/YjgQ family permease [Rhodospirillaceae bacterium]
MRLKAIDQYVVGLITPTLAVTLLIAAVVLAMERLMRLLDIAVGNGVSTLVVFQMFFNLIPYYISLALPVGVFLGVLLAFRRLSMQSELDAIHSCGIGIGRLIRPALAVGAVAMIFYFLLSGYIMPYTRYIFNRIMFNITSGVIEQGIGEGVFMSLPNGYTLRVEESHGGGRELSGVFAHRQEDDGRITTLTAKRGELMNRGIDGSLSLRLYEGNRSEWDPASKASSSAQFDVLDWPLSLADLLHFRGRGGDERELTIFELMRGYWDNVTSGRMSVKAEPNPLPDAPPEHVVAPSAVASEFHFRLVFSLSIFLLPLLAAPFGIVSHRSSRSFGLVAGLSMLVSYHKVLEFTQAYTRATAAPAGLLLWSVFILFALGTAWLFTRTDMQSGAPPVQRFEAQWVRFIDGIGAIFRSKRPSTPA